MRVFEQFNAGAQVVAEADVEGAKCEAEGGEYLVITLWVLPEVANDKS